jgi:oligoendopeptidase F
MHICTLWKKGFNPDGFDVYEQPGKTSVGYSFGSYDSMPYILMNYNGKRKDIFTLVHEMGHSMHSYYTRKNQPFIYGGHSNIYSGGGLNRQRSIINAPSADKGERSQEHIGLLNQYLEEFRTLCSDKPCSQNLRPSVMKLSQNGTILTNSWLPKRMISSIKNTMEMPYRRLPLSPMSGQETLIFIEFFTCIKYATGYSAAIAIAENILKGGAKEQKDYLDFLASGESDYPIELLQIAGVHMDTPIPCTKPWKPLMPW